MLLTFSLSQHYAYSLPFSWPPKDGNRTRPLGPPVAWLGKRPAALRRKKNQNKNQVDPAQLEKAQAQISGWAFFLPSFCLIQLDLTWVQKKLDHFNRAKPEPRILAHDSTRLVDILTTSLSVGQLAWLSAILLYRLTASLISNVIIETAHWSIYCVAKFRA